MKTNDGMNTSALENQPRTPDPQAVGVPPLAPGSVAYALFEHMSQEHGLTLIGSELDEIIRVVNSALDERLRWWIANAEGIAQERGELFRAGEAMRAVMVGHAWDGEEVGAWDASAQPMRDMIAALSQNNRNLPRDRVGSRELVSFLSEWERAAFGNESAFLGRFCHDAWQLAKVSWSSETMHVVYIADSGQHITDSFPLRDWLEFYEVVERERERCRRTERKESRVRILERHRKVAQMVLRDGMSIKDAGKAIGVGKVCARTLLHRWCAHANPELYKSGYHHNEYEGGWSNDCPPHLNWLRDHAEDFAANDQDQTRGASDSHTQSGNHPRCL